MDRSRHLESELRWSGFYFVPPYTVENGISLNYEGLIVLRKEK